MLREFREYEMRGRDRERQRERGVRSPSQCEMPCDAHPHKSPPLMPELRSVSGGERGRCPASSISQQAASSRMPVSDCLYPLSRDAQAPTILSCMIPLRYFMRRMRGRRRQQVFTHVNIARMYNAALLRRPKEWPVRAAPLDTRLRDRTLRSMAHAVVRYTRKELHRPDAGFYTLQNIVSLVIEHERWETKM